MNRGYLIDMDGVIYRGSEAIPGAAEFILYLQTAGIPFLFLTNNSGYMPLDVVVKLRKLNIETSKITFILRRWPPPNSSTNNALAARHL